MNIEDFDFLAERRMLVFQFPVASLETLKDSVLRRVNIVVRPWSEVYKKLDEQFVERLSAQGRIKKVDAQTTLLRFNIKNYDKLEALVTKYNSVLGKYSCRCKIDLGEVPKYGKGEMLARLRVGYDDTINPSFFFSRFFENSETYNATLNLSSHAQLRFTTKNIRSESERPKFHIEFLDMIERHFKPVFHRTFDLTKIKTEEILEMISFLFRLIPFAKMSQSQKPGRSPTR